MRVLMVTNGLGAGGAERQLALLAGSLPHSWSAVVLSMEDGPFRVPLEESGVEVHIVTRRFRSDAFAAVRLWLESSCIAPDIVHSWDWMSSIAMVPFCRVHRIPLLNGTIRRGYLPERHVGVEKLGLALADAVVANSRAGLVAYGLAEDERSSVVYNGFDLSRLDTLEAAHRATGARDSVSVVMVARMHPAKDWRLLVQVAREISLGTTGWRFIAVGSGPERGEIYAGATDLIDAGVIEFREPGLEVLPVVASADIGVLLSNSPDFAEGCSNSILEYMACGLPVVCTASGGNPELVEHGATGLLIPPHSGEALVSALRQLTDDSMALHEMGKEGRRRVTAQFTVRTMVRSYVSLYETLMVRRGAQPA